ncbi:protein translocase subunit SecD [Natroniella sulfidigena]|uniref:protein translocase subunit SecD n=1 Tax=Natroniella sulfidigena TaxID=723921 RepID=UPI00200A642C|nr:protein translocase subunit SecD [Natroniella sulfidigena]MCK8815971.1 protein translocase subunit SecD [Natroniella sulfidigena]
MTWKQKRKLRLASVLVILLLAAYFLYPLSESINLGLDLQGGTQVTLEAQDTEDTQVDDDAMRRSMSVIQNRVDEMGLAEPIVQREGERRILVALPGVEDPNQAIETIGRTAQLQFKNEEGEVLMTGEHLNDASAGHEAQFNQPIISFQLTGEGGRRFAEITRQNIGRRLGIYLDDELLTNPVINEEIPGGEGQITGFESIEEAQQIALMLRAGALPVPIEIIENRTVGPTLGATAVNQSIQAALIGLSLIILFMIFSYKLPGLVAAISLGIYSIIVLGILAGLNATLTLPGIGGLLLSIGMAVDANVIIFERIKYEYREGKGLKRAVNTGFKRAFKTILDSNVTTLITAAILAYFGTGIIRGFAITLSVGIIASMFTAIIVAKLIMDLVLDTKLVDNEKIFALSRR